MKSEQIKKRGLTAEDANMIEMSMREIYSASSPDNIGSTDSTRIRKNITAVRSILSKVLVPVANLGNKSDLRLTRASQLKAFKLAKNIAGT